MVRLYSFLLGAEILAERGEARKLAAGRGDIGPLAHQVIVDGAAQAGIGDIVRGTSRRRHVAARNLVFALGAGFDPRQLVRDGKIDRLVIAEFEVQKRMMLDGAPVAPE